MTGISSNGEEHLLSYYMFGRPSETEINGLTTMSTTYNSDGQLSRVDYLNGDMLNIHMLTIITFLQAEQR